MPDDYKAVIQRLRDERRMTLEDLAFEARTRAPKGTVSLSLIQKRLAPSSTAQPSMQLLEALAHALGVPATEFAEYQLADARRLLDEEAIGLDQAMANLDALQPILEKISRANGADADDLVGEVPGPPGGLPPADAEPEAEAG